MNVYFVPKPAYCWNEKAHAEKKMKLYPSESKSAKIYGALVSSILPRPIGWISTVSETGQQNLAPFSFFNVASVHPPVLMFCPLNTLSKRSKDTLRNVRETGEFVHNVTSRLMLAKIDETSEPLPYGESEADAAQIKLVSSDLVRPARVEESPISMECRVLDIKSFGSEPLSGHVVFGEILVIHIQDSVLTNNNYVDIHKLDVIGRVGSDYYCSVDHLIKSDKNLLG